MLTKQNLFKIGKLQKPHGIQGELTLTYDQAIYADIDTEFYFLDIDSIFVPFLIEELTLFGDNRGRVKLEDLDDEVQASRYTNYDIYIQRHLIDETPELEEEAGWDYFVGYTIIDQYEQIIGEIAEVDSSTMNTLFIIYKDEDEIIIPATEDFITHINNQLKQLHMQIPQGLLD